MADDTLNIISDLVNKALSHGADMADAVSFDSADVNVAMRLGNLESLERSESKGVGLRVMVGKSKAIVSSSDLQSETLDGLARQAVDMARLAPEDPYTDIADESLYVKEVPDLDLYDSAEPEVASLIEKVKSAEGVALATEGITNSDGAEASYSSAVISLANSKGFVRQYPVSSSSLAVSVVAGEGTQMERDYDYSVARHGSDLKDAKEIGKNAADRTIKRLNPRKPSTGEMPVIFDPRVAKNLLAAFAGSVNGAAIARGTSFLKDSMNQDIFSKQVKIINDSKLPRGLGSKPYDGEGVETGSLELISEGKLVSWLLDIRSANQLGLKTNGSASRGLASNPSPSYSNLYMENGESNPEEFIADIKSGFYVSETFGTGINLVTGDYSQGASGFWIENGELTYPVSELTIASNLLHMFKSLIAANDLVFEYAVNSPTLRIDGVTVAGV